MNVALGVLLFIGVFVAAVAVGVGILRVLYGPVEDEL